MSRNRRKLASCNRLPRAQAVGAGWPLRDYEPSEAAAREYTAMALATLAEIAKKGEIEFDEMTEAEIAASASARPEFKDNYRRARFNTLQPWVPYTFGNPPSGYYLHDATGQPSIQIMTTPPQTIATPDEPTLAEALAICNGFIAYYGTYSIDAAKSQCKWKARGIQARFGVPCKQDLINCREIP